MATLEKSQFSRIEFEQWATSNSSEEINGSNTEETPPKLRGMRMFNQELNDPQSLLNTKKGGWKNVRTVRVMQSTAADLTWSLDYALIRSEQDIYWEKANAEAAELQKKADEEAKIGAEKKAKEDAEKAKRAAFKKERDDRLRALGKKPFKKKSVKPELRKNSKAHHARPNQDRH